ncbi:hypothetical protein [Sphingomonas sp. PWP1-2]|uniref:hypothetical protein n=1 Tax=Sphingomonas sp. PWP1-2 TaxID=2804558 RepID=UPI003CF04595
MKHFSNVQKALGFVAACVVAGIGLHDLAGRAEDGTAPAISNAGTALNYTDAASVEASADAIADDLDNKANAMDAADRSAPAGSSASDGDARSRGEDAGRWDNSVFGDGNNGALSCAFDGSKPFRVDWEANDGSGNVSIDGIKTNGRVTGDWEPAANKVRFDIEVAESKVDIGHKLYISDNGELSDDNSQKGSCNVLQ